MTNAQRVVAILLEESPSVRGEYWITPDGVWFADGDMGDINHEGYVIDTARRRILDFLDADSGDEFIDEEEFARLVTESLSENGFEIPAGMAYDDVFDQYATVQGKPEYIPMMVAAMNAGDPRDYAVKNWGWKWVRGCNVSTWTYTADDRSDIANGFDEIGDEEGFIDGEDGLWDDLEVSITVGATGKHYSATLRELKGGQTPQRDPTWGKMESQEPDESLNDEDQMIADVAMQGVRANSVRMLKPGDEISHGTSVSEDNARAYLRTIEALDPQGYTDFCEYYSDEIFALETVEGGSNDTADHNCVEEFAYQTLPDYLSTQLCPVYCDVGPSDGDSTLLGCWVNFNGLEIGVDEGLIAKVEPNLSSFQQWQENRGKFAPEIKYVWLHDEDGVIFKPDTDVLYDAKTKELLWQY